jgi:hypothetical protein
MSRSPCGQDARPRRTVDLAHQPQHRLTTVRVRSHGSGVTRERRLVRALGGVSQSGGCAQVTLSGSVIREEFRPWAGGQLFVRGSGFERCCLGPRWFTRG